MAQDNVLLDNVAKAYFEMSWNSGWHPKAEGGFNRQWRVKIGGGVMERIEEKDSYLEGYNKGLLGEQMGVGGDNNEQSRLGTDIEGFQNTTVPPPAENGEDGNRDLWERRNVKDLG